jgi:carboxyl-terminal processing protease
MNTQYKKSIIASIALLAVGASFIFGVTLGYKNRPEVSKITSLVEKEAPGTLSTVDFSTFWKAWNILNAYYVDPKKSSDQDKVYGAIQGLAQSFKDPYTVFFPPEDNKSFQEEIAGSFDGIGMEVDIKDGVLTVVAPLKGNPAEKAGIKSGDKILKINDTVTADMSVEQAVKIIRGKKGTTVRLTLYRDQKQGPFEVSVVRDVIQMPMIETELRPDGVFVIRLASFSATSPNLFRKALREFYVANTDKLILDLRGNPGGYLEAAVDMASFFLPAGQVIVSEDYGGKRNSNVYKSHGPDVFSDQLKFVILVDGGSASASEILAGALKEHGRAKLVGSKTFGKGSVQELVPLTSDTNLKITVAKWLTPKGNSISEKGIIPDYVVDITAEDVQKKDDRQLKKAVDVLLNWQK